MAYEVRSETRPNSVGLDCTIFVLLDAARGAAVEVWPALGFNCYHWQTTRQGRSLDLLYADPQLFSGGRPTRSGIPILFPFPNRIRDGRFSWQGKTYQLPTNDPAGKNAIHGFACRKPWRVVDQGADAASAWLTGEFVGSVDAPESLAHWPADYRLRLTWRLTQQGLRIEAVVGNPDRQPLPFGLGYHPYFRIPFTSGVSEQEYAVECSARKYWELEDSLPTGKLLPLNETRDLRTGRLFPSLTLDDVFTDLAAGSPPGPDALCWRGGLLQADNGVTLQVLTSPAFRELVLFTPPHRQAVCLEPYTCATDAVNLQQRGLDAGWLVLEPGAEWRGTVELRVAESK